MILKQANYSLTIGAIIKVLRQTDAQTHTETTKLHTGLLAGAKNLIRLILEVCKHDKIIYFCSSVDIGSTICVLFSVQLYNPKLRAVS